MRHLAALKALAPADIGILRRVPRPAAWRCPNCCGPMRPGFNECYGCRRLWGQAPSELFGHIVPVTTSPEGGAWYSALVSYKHTDKSRWPLMATITGAFMEVHRGDMADLLGGDSELLCVVPSTRGAGGEKQPLFQVAKLISTRGDGLPQARAVLAHAGHPKRRNAYNPKMFTVVKRNLVRGRRILLLDDSWASGATMVSAAGALLDARAMSVVLLPIARLYNAPFWRGEPEVARVYERAMGRPWNVQEWPL